MTPPAKSPRPTPAFRPGRRERHRTETRERIFRAALDLFARRGFHETTIEDITEAADVGKGTFFNYFPSKEHVLAALGDIQIGKIERVVLAARAAQRPLREILRDFAHLISEEPGRSPLLMRAVMVAFLTSEPVRSLFLERLAQGRGLLTELVALGQQSGEVRRDAAPAAAARALQQAFFGAMLLWSTQPNETLARRLERQLEMIWQGFASRDGRRGRLEVRR